MKKLYLFLAIIGFILPLSQFISWLLEFGVDVVLMFHTIVEDKLSLFAWLDVIVSAVMLVVFVLTREAFKKQTLSVMFVT